MDADFECGLRDVSHNSGDVAKEVDIVFVHGFAGHPIRSWASQKSVAFWPRDFLARDLPSARVLLYGFNERLTTLWELPVQTITEECRKLSHALLQHRHHTSTEARPIIWMAHSLGGLLCRQILAQRASEDSIQTMPSLVTSTVGIVLFGVPVRSDSRSLSQIFKTFYDLTSKTPIIRWPRSGDLEAFLSVDRAFEQLLNNPHWQTRVCCVYETQELTGVGLVVSRERATLPNATFMASDRDHLKMVKFDSDTDKSYRSICDLLRKWLADLKGQATIQPTELDVTGDHKTSLLPTQARLYGTDQAEQLNGKGQNAQSRAAQQNILDALLAEDSPDRAAVLSARYELATIVTGQRDWHAAVDLWRDLIHEASEDMRRNHRLSVALFNMGYVMQNLYSHTRSESWILQSNHYFERVIRSHAARHFDHSPLIVSAYLGLFANLLLKGEEENAIYMAPRLRNVAARCYGHDSAKAVAINLLISDVLIGLDRLSEAEDIQSSAVHVLEQTLGEHHPDCLSAKSQLVRTYIVRRKLIQAEELQQVVNFSTRKVFGPGHPRSCCEALQLALVFRLNGKMIEAKNIGSRELEVAREMFGKDNPITALIALAHTRTLVMLGQVEVARGIQNRVSKGLARQQNKTVERPRRTKEECYIYGRMKWIFDHDVGDPSDEDDLLRVSLLQNTVAQYPRLDFLESTVHQLRWQPDLTVFRDITERDDENLFAQPALLNQVTVKTELTRLMSRYVSQQKLQALLRMLFNHDWRVEMRGEAWIIEAPRKLTRKEIESLMYKGSSDY